ncbi:MAG: type II toxin-antitoxin system VapC family toxin [Candidatus Ozemobacteraceae bacterium]
MIVVDTNIIAHFYIPGEFSSMADSIKLKDSEWITSHLWRFEFRNVIQKYIRAKLIELPDAIQILEDAEIALFGKEISVPPSQFINVAANSKCSGYDCEFVSVAKGLNLKLITFDKKIVREFPDHAILATTFLNEPSTD